MYSSVAVIWTYSPDLIGINQGKMQDKEHEAGLIGVFGSFLHSQSSSAQSHLTDVSLMISQYNAVLDLLQLCCMYWMCGATL